MSPATTSRGSRQAFDLLYWNSRFDQPAGPFACWYMRNLYLDNSLRVPGKLEMRPKADLIWGAWRCRSISTCSREDHIVPWKRATCPAHSGR